MCVPAEGLSSNKYVMNEVLAVQPYNMDGQVGSSKHSPTDPRVSVFKGHVWSV